MPDSPENKCPDECPECGSEKRWPPPVWTDGESGVTEECWHPWHEKPRCPDCGGMGSGEGGFRGGKKWKAICPGCGGSGRINTSGDFIGDKPGQGEHSCHENCPCSPALSNTESERSPEVLRSDPKTGHSGVSKSGLPPSPDRETGECEWTTDAELARDIATGIGGFWDDEPMGEDPPFGPDDVARAVVEVLVEGRLSPSAAPTNSGAGSRSDSEGELRARIEELAEKYEEVAALALGFASEKVSCSSVASDLRSLLVPKEEA